MITIRKATPKDCDIILEWENNPLLYLRFFFIKTL
jgi:hypothetical protein